MKKLAQRGAQISASSSPFLDKLFAKFQHPQPRVPYASPSTPIQSSPSKVRGISALVVQEMFKRRAFRGHPAKLENEFMRVIYFPPWHPLAAARTTRPAIVVTYNASLVFNGEKVDAAPVKTFGTAVFRNRAKYIYKRLFMDAWNKNGLDGLYMIVALKLPRENDAVRIAKGLEEYMYLVRNTMPQWASRPAQPINPRVFTSMGLPVPPHSQPSDWDDA